MKKYLFRIFGYFILSVVIAGMGTVIGIQQKRIKEQKETNKYLMNENDELRKLKTYHFETKLSVTDKSKLTVNGKGNSGTINVPTDINYIISIDSASIYRFFMK